MTRLPRHAAPLPPCHYAIISRFAIAAIIAVFATAFIAMFCRDASAFAPR
jgi:hypothetical protein